MTDVEDPFHRLLERRTAFLRGPLDDAAANRLAAELMTLDATGEGEITLLVNSDGGPVECLFPVSDTMALLRSPVATTCLGQASGTAAVVVALGTARRRAAPPRMGGAKRGSRDWAATKFRLGATRR